MKIKRNISTESTLRFQEQPRFYLNKVIPTPLSDIARNSKIDI